MNLRDKLIKAGVKHLKEYGYPECNKDNIITDIIYSEFFKSMLEGNKGQSDAADEVIDGILAEIAADQQVA